mmetsp:Transcript_2512/g.3545  ORF Transcript_2512/g.3545 Transcript_2512/m.3545 type:complete len:150 (-) Transcript_2512:253-702(-)
MFVDKQITTFKCLTCRDHLSLITCAIVAWLSSNNGVGPYIVNPRDVNHLPKCKAFFVDVNMALVSALLVDDANFTILLQDHATVTELYKNKRLVTNHLLFISRAKSASEAAIKLCSFSSISANPFLKYNLKAECLYSILPARYIMEMRL